MLLKNNVVFLTGGSAGIGRECAKAYVREGALLCIADKHQQSLDAVMRELGPCHLGVCCDVSRGAEVNAAIHRAIAFFGKIDAIHNNAGIAHPAKALDETSETEWDDLVANNLKSAYLTTKYGIEALKASRGTILNTSSMVGVIGQEMHAAYAATKGAMNALTKSMALDYAKYGIRVNAVCPAGVWTPLLRKWAAEQADTASIREYLDNIHVLGYCPEGDVVADACVFLLSDKARFITGCLLPVSGGAELGYRALMRTE